MKTCLKTILSEQRSVSELRNSGLLFELTGRASE
jgi:hypothetical protein